MISDDAGGGRGSNRSRTEINRYTAFGHAGLKDFRGADAERSYCVRAGANSNEPGTGYKHTVAAEPSKRTQVIAATESGRPVYTLVFEIQDRARLLVSPTGT